jgi:hypothetical protein
MRLQPDGFKYLHSSRGVCCDRGEFTRLQPGRLCSRKSCESEENSRKTFSSVQKANLSQIYEPLAPSR